MSIVFPAYSAVRITPFCSSGETQRLGAAPHGDGPSHSPSPSLSADANANASAPRRPAPPSLRAMAERGGSACGAGAAVDTRRAGWPKWSATNTTAKLELCLRPRAKCQTQTMLPPPYTDPQRPLAHVPSYQTNSSYIPTNSSYHHSSCLPERSE